ncbi:MAG TPA: hypothetical protein VKT28_21510 [Puia sp.]|nr:hypothetical protein [Puia sp.]
MKKIIFIAALAAFSYANAQTESIYAVNRKTALENANAYFNNFETTSDAVNAKALKNFSNHYASATNAQWSETKEKGMTCRFYIKGILNRAYYNADGSWAGTITSYSETLLPDNIKAMVNNLFPEYSITNVNEVNTSGNQTVFIVYVESMKHIKVLKLTADSDIEVQQELDKQN